MLPARPQLLNQEPPRPQQLAFPDFAIVAHLEHSELIDVVVAAMCEHWSNTITVTESMVNNLTTYAITPGLTVAGLHALNPTVIQFFVCSTSAVLEPSAAGSATTDSAGFGERATPRTRHRTEDR